MSPAKIPKAGIADYRIKQLVALRKCKVQENANINSARFEEGMQTRCSASGYVQPPPPPPHRRIPAKLHTPARNWIFTSTPPSLTRNAVSHLLPAVDMCRALARLHEGFLLLTCLIILVQLHRTNSSESSLFDFSYQRILVNSCSSICCVSQKEYEARTAHATPARWARRGWAQNAFLEEGHAHWRHRESVQKHLHTPCGTTLLISPSVNCRSCGRAPAATVAYLCARAQRLVPNIDSGLHALMP